MHTDEDTARTRFAIISLVRLGGAVLVAIGMLSIADAIDWIPTGLDYAAVAAGLFGAMIAPRMLARRWRTPDDER